MNYKTLIAAAALALGSCTYTPKPVSIESKLEITEMTPEEMENVRGSPQEEAKAYQKSRNYTQNQAVRNALYKKR